MRASDDIRKDLKGLPLEFFIIYGKAWKFKGDFKESELESSKD